MMAHPALVREARRCLFMDLKNVAEGLLSEGFLSEGRLAEGELSERHRALSSYRDVCSFLGLKRAALYCASTQAVFRDTGSTGDKQSILLLAFATLHSSAALWVAYPDCPEDAAAGLIGTAALNRLRLFLRRRALPPGQEEEAPAVALARLAAPRLLALIGRHRRPSLFQFLACRCHAHDERARIQAHIQALSPLGILPPLCWVDPMELRHAIAASACNMLTMQLLSTLRHLRLRLSSERTLTDGRAHQALYGAAVCNRQSASLCAFVDGGTSEALHHLLTTCIWSLLREEEGVTQHGGTCWRLLLHGLEGLERLLPLMLTPPTSGQRGHSLRDVSAMPLADVLSDILRPDQSLTESGQYSLPPELSASLAQETADYLRRLTEMIPLDGQLRLIDAQAGVLMYKLALNLRTTRRFDSWALCHSLQQTLKCHVEQRAPAGAELRRILHAFLDTVSAMHAASVDVHAEGFRSLDSLRSRALILEAETAMRLAKAPLYPLPLYLASNIRCLMRVDEVLARITAAGAIVHAEAEDENSDLAVLAMIQEELRVLADGARRLRVYRVEALAAALHELSQPLLDKRHVADETTWQLLQKGHRQLRVMLNQAAARQEVMSARPLVASIYHWLERQPGCGVADPAPDAYRLAGADGGINLSAAALMQLAGLASDCQSGQQRLSRIGLRSGAQLEEQARSALIEALAVQSRQLALLEAHLKQLFPV